MTRYLATLSKISVAIFCVILRACCHSSVCLEVNFPSGVYLQVCRSSLEATGTCFIQKIYASSSSLLQGKYLHFSPSPLRLNMFRLFVILSLTQLYRYTPEIFLFSTATFKYTYRAPLGRIGQEYSANVACFIFNSLKRIQPLPVCAGFSICIRNSLNRPCVTMPSWSSPLKCKVSL